MSRRTTGVLLLLGLVQVLAYGWALHLPSGVGFGCFDQGCSLQAARRIAEGCPFSYAPGLPPSTGQTSVLHPFLLAVPALFGAGEAAMRAAAFAFAGVLYLAFLLAWGCVFDRLFPKRGPGLGATVAMTGLSGGCGYAAFTMCDQGLWMAVSAMIAAAMVLRKRRLEVALLCLAPWIRPEGMMVTVSAVFARVLAERRKVRIGDVLLPLLSILSVFVLNFALTGHLQFSSVAGKGHFNAMPFGEAVCDFGRDLLAILGSYLGSVPVPRNRLFCMTSPAVVVCFWIGIAAVLFRRHLRSILEFELLPFVLAALLAVAAVASGGFSGLDFDRYLAWMMPLVFLAAGRGFDEIVRRIRAPFVRRLLAVALVATVLFSTVAMTVMMRRTTGPRTARFEAVRAEARHLPENASVGGGFNWAYAMPKSVRFLDVNGIFTPVFAGCCASPALAYERLKHDPSLRFGYWAATPSEGKDDTPALRRLMDELYGETLVGGTEPRYIRRADWSAFDRANESPLAEAVPVARLDVAYAPDERAAGLHAEDGSSCPCYVGASPGRRATDGRMMCDGFAMVHCGHAFSLDVTPGRDAVLVLRTLGQLRDVSRDVASRIAKTYGPTVRLKISVNGRVLGSFDVPLQPDVFTDYRVDVPAEYLTSPRTEFRIEGRFAAFGYWLYQT